ncbi:unnamed protein product [Cuscuta europaea]|uniref:Protein LHCP TRANSLOCATION DEFECT n=1 Tax=Cuscuta europaea TaxID=41803 RepID=A0A9P0ZUG7_CUSEU|nr:unnamed protein product [Cuscuta europaea]
MAAAASISSAAAAAAMIIHHHHHHRTRLIPSSSCCSLRRWPKLKTELLGGRCGGPSCGRTRISCWFRFGGGGKSSRRQQQSRDDFDRDDVEQYFNYMGMLAVEGSYDKMEALLNQDIHPVDVLLLLAASEGDQPKIQELLTAGADYTVKDADGRTALDRAAAHDEDLKSFMLNLSLPYL